MTQKILFENNQWHIPNNPIIGFITGDGIGTDVTPAAIKVINAALAKVYKNQKTITWQKVLIGEEAAAQGKDNLSNEALNQIKDLRVVLKGPLSTPIGSGFRSLNVGIRQKLDLYACVRPVKYFPGVPAPVKEPQNLNVTIFRENTEDVYAGIEWKQGSPEVKDLIDFCAQRGKSIRQDSGIGIKPISIQGSKRLIRSAVNYALKNNKRVVTLVHKGNIMKFTEGAFKEWGYQLVKEEFADQCVLEGEANPNNLLVINDRIADAMFQQLLLRPSEYDVIATMNLNGDYLSDACAAQVGGLGLAPGANINYELGIAVFEATHGTAPKYASLDKVNPTSVLLSGVMMLKHLGWQEAADAITKAIETTIEQKKVTYDLERQMQGATLLKCSQFANAIIENL